MYPDVAYGMEGDTPSWLALIPNGLNAPERPDWGGWGGRYELYQPHLAAMAVRNHRRQEIPARLCPRSTAEECRPTWPVTFGAVRTLSPSQARIRLSFAG